jgi:hypothetical protein
LRTGELKKKLEEAVNFISDAIYGLEWWMNTFPEQTSSADMDKVGELKDFLESIKPEESDNE